MNNRTFRNCVVAAVISAALAAIYSFAISPAKPHSDVKSGMVISAHHGVLVADGSESNGGKGGGKGNS